MKKKQKDKLIDKKIMFVEELTLFLNNKKKETNSSKEIEKKLKWSREEKEFLDNIMKNINDISVLSKSGDFNFYCFFENYFDFFDWNNISKEEGGSFFLLNLSIFGLYAILCSFLNKKYYFDFKIGDEGLFFYNYSENSNAKIVVKGVFSSLSFDKTHILKNKVRGEEIIETVPDKNSNITVY